MDLAAWMVLATITVFAVGALFALAWSIASGQWRDLRAGARVVLLDDLPRDDSTHPRPHGGS